MKKILITIFILSSMLFTNNLSAVSMDKNTVKDIILTNIDMVSDYLKDDNAFIVNIVTPLKSKKIAELNAYKLKMQASIDTIDSQINDLNK